ncbi:hypothetical protein ACN6MT_03200 [Neobacillus niacini]|uniref:hypothetical protein n=1 Tax=Neobacillus niacini TaxID=86668 RepID=UPI003B023D62
MEKQLVFSEFVEACYEYGDKLADKKIRCEYFISSSGDHFAMYFDCTDGSYIAVELVEKSPKVWVKVIKNEKVDRMFKQTRFADGYHTDLQGVFESIEKHVDKHGGHKSHR